MADIHRTNKDIPLCIQAEEGRVRHKALRIVLSLQVFQVTVKIVVVISADRIGNDLLPRRIPLIHHFIQVPLICRRQLYKLQIHFLSSKKLFK